MGERVGAVLGWIGRNGKRIGVTIVGFLVVLLGIFMSLPLIPGPGILVILVGLAILATEYAWARRALEKARERAKQAGRRIARIGRGKKTPTEGE